jgi:sugar/nucleoside kinase (ribokinase family)
MDILQPDVDFSSPAFRALGSRHDGDGGLTPGRLVFAEDAEVFGGRPFPAMLRDLVGDAPPAAENVGGPSVVALIHAAQMLEGEGATISFHGARGDDGLGDRLEALLRRTPLSLEGWLKGRGSTPSTWVLSDPRWDSGRGERCFVNEIGAAAHFAPADLGPEFGSADIVALGGTALVPALHDGLPGVLSEARGRSALTIVNTVFDFRSERRAPSSPWPLGGSSAPGREPGPPESYRNCDLIVMDRDEALRLSGETRLEAAIRYFTSSGVGAFVVTRGAESVIAWAGQGRFEPFETVAFPVIDRPSARSMAEAAGFAGAASGGDTTGCGDAFAGGIIASLARQLSGSGKDRLDLEEAIGWGIAGGAFTLSILGGTWFETRPGEKRLIVEAIHQAWPGRREGYRHG